MSVRRRRRIDTLAGQGRVYRDQERIAEVFYTLEVFQDYVVTRGGQDLPGLKEIRGSLQVVSGQQALAFRDPTLTLELEDGRLLTIIVTQQQIPGGTCRVMGSGGFFVRDEPKTGG